MLAYPAIDPVALEIGPLVIRWYALAYLAGFVLGWRICLRLARGNPPGLPQPVDYDDFLTWAVVGTVLGGRIGYVLFYNLPYYIKFPLDTLMVWHGGMSFHGGLAGVVVAILLFCRKRGLSAFAFADLIAAVAPIGLFFGRIANFINGELFGRPAEGVPWSMVFPHDQWQLPRHPSQLYEAGLEGLVLFAVVVTLVRLPAVRARAGLTAGIFFIGYGLARITAEFFREPDPQLGFLWGGATMGQVLSIPMVLFGLWLALRARPTGEAAA